MQPDLSEQHGPVGDLFSLPDTTEGWRRFSLSAEQVAFYHEHGYLKGVRVLDDGQVGALRAELAGLTELFCKPARHGGVVAWHQDYSYWTRTKPLAHLTCWTGLDDSTRENGCLH